VKLGSWNLRLQPTLLAGELNRQPTEMSAMIKWAFLFLVIGLIAGLLGFTGIAGASIGIAKLLFFIAIAIFVVMLVLGYTVFKKAT